MVGWKIAVRQVPLVIGDLAIVAREFAGGALFEGVGGHQSGAVDGSYFTDYVHHVALSQPVLSPREVTKDFVTRLLRPAEIRALLEMQGESVREDAGVAQLSEHLLSSFGWRERRGEDGKSLASCLAKGDGGALRLASALSHNDIRIRLESFCKDVVDVIVAQLGYRKDTDLWKVIGETVPDYLPRSWRGDWSEEVAHLTVGSASKLIEALGSLAFSSQAASVARLVAGLNRLSSLLNRGSHDQEPESTGATAEGEPADLVREVLEAASGFLGELPWHLSVSFVYGEQPKVLSGEAWSHGSATPRFLRVIQWTGESVGRQALLWSRARTNPIITDPVFISRPYSRTERGS
jgi:hypothetical protein